MSLLSCCAVEHLRDVLQEPSGGRGILIQWPTIIHATAYVVDLYEELGMATSVIHRMYGLCCRHEHCDGFTESKLGVSP